MDPKARDFFVAATFVMVAGFIVSLGRRSPDSWTGGRASLRPEERADRKGQTHAGTINWHATVMLTVTVSRCSTSSCASPTSSAGRRAGVARAVAPRGSLVTSAPRTAARSCSSTASTSRTSRRSGTSPRRTTSGSPAAAAPLRSPLDGGGSSTRLRRRRRRCRPRRRRSSTRRSRPPEPSRLSGERASSQTFKLLSIEAPDGPAAVGTAFTRRARRQRHVPRHPR